jgi:glycosyltransferase involved in cell wall biosynthesis
LSFEAPLKILFVNTMYPPEIVGGAEVSVSLLAEALVGRGHEVVAVCLHRGSTPAVGEIKGVRVYRLPIDNIYWPFEDRLRRPAFQRLIWHLRDIWNRKAARRFGEVLDIEKPDVVHTNNLTGFSVSLWREARRRRVRIVHTLRDYSLICKRATLFRNGQTCWSRCMACATLTAPCLYNSHLVDAVASNSQFVLDRHLKLGYFPEIPDKVIYNIAHLDNVERTPSRPSGDLVFGFIGRIESEKGIDILLKATDLLPDAGWRLKIAGKGVDGYVRGLKARHPSNRIDWLGFTQGRDFYAAVDVCIISSVWPEPLPRTLIESMGEGRPTICSTAGGIPEISSMSALIGSYEPHDHHRLAALMMRTINEASQWKRSHPLRPQFAEKFSPDAIVSQYLGLYAVREFQTK